MVNIIEFRIILAQPNGAANEPQAEYFNQLAGSENVCNNHYTRNALLPYDRGAMNQAKLLPEPIHKMLAVSVFCKPISVYRIFPSYATTNALSSLESCVMSVFLNNNKASIFKT